MPAKNFLTFAVFTAPTNISISQVQYCPLLQEGNIKIFAFFYFIFWKALAPTSLSFEKKFSFQASVLSDTNIWNAFVAKR